MKKINNLKLIFLSLAASSLCIADNFTLRDGQELTGKLISIDTKDTIIEIAGQSLKFDRNTIASITFGDVVKPELSKADVNPLLQDDTIAQEKTAPIGTRLVVRTEASINSNQHKAGHRFNARLEGDIVVNGVVIAPKGTKLYGVIEAATRSGRLIGNSELLITFTDIMINNQMIPISTSSVKAITEDTGKNTVGATARGAAIGGLANGSKGAKDGARVGMGLSILSGGNSINIPAGTMLEFQLATPLTAK